MKFGTCPVINMSADGSSALPQDIIDAKSPANQYLVQLLEDKGALSFQPITEERIRLLFQIWDKVSPQLGTFSRLMGLLGAELYDAVYLHPGSQLWKDWQGTHAVAYFSLVRRMQDERNQEADGLRSELRRVSTTYEKPDSQKPQTDVSAVRVMGTEGRCIAPDTYSAAFHLTLQQLLGLLLPENFLSQKEDAVVTLGGRVSALQRKNQNLESAITALRLEAAESRREAERLGSVMAALDTQLEVERQTHGKSLSDLQCQLSTCHVHVREMEERTASYTALQRAFQPPMTRMKQNVLSAPGKVPADRTAMSTTFVSSYLQTSRHTYQQLLQVQNAVMDDFDAFLERRVEGSHPQLDEEAQSFLTTLADLSLELSLLSQQRESLEERLAGHGQVSAAARSVDCGRRLPSDTESPEEEAEEGNVGRFLCAALYPDETLLNRYAAMIYASSDHGQIFQELPGADVCHSCAEKTLLCPHRFGGSRLIRLPQNCTHIKICRPQVHLSVVQAKIAVGTLRSLVSDIHGNHRTEITQKSPDGSGSQSGAASGVVDWSLSGLEKEFGGIHLKTESCRVISLELCVSVSQQLAAIFVLQLEGKSPISRMQDAVRGFFRKRYVQEDIGCRGLEDFLCAVRRYAPESQVLSLLGSILTCDSDPSALCYVLLHADVILESPLSDMGHVQHFLQQNYHFLEETERDRLLLEFTAYSKKCVSPSRVMSFIVHLILQHREPLIMECRDELSTHMKTHTGHLTEDELAGALDEMSLRTDKTQITSFIRRSVTLSGRSLITLRRAAQIAAYQLQRIQRWKKNPEGSRPDSDPGSTGNTAKCPDLHILSNILHLTQIT